MVLDERIAGSTTFIVELPLCNLYLQNESRFPWLVLVPRMDDVSELIDLSEEEQQQLTREIAIVSKLMQSMFKPDKLNVANLGNVVAQLHIHVVARYITDAAWPDPIWGKFSEPLKYSMAESETLVKKIQDQLVNNIL